MFQPTVHNPFKITVPGSISLPPGIIPFLVYHEYCFVEGDLWVVMPYMSITLTHDWSIRSGQVISKQPLISFKAIELNLNGLTF